MEIEEAIERIKEHMRIHFLREPMSRLLNQALTMAIKALEDIQEYRKLGTVEEIKAKLKQLELYTKE